MLNCQQQKIKQSVFEGDLRLANHFDKNYNLSKELKSGPGEPER